ncbi:TetM/TetW/TetO/TetS family tetracycline resistance ribosomal protection protein [Streptomyces spinosirectus]|uniref:elongation factor G n=1 Tax=Streptomyces TaxID=1883 RepID=UPI001C9DE3AB|nr:MULTISPECIES: TetM/TetW/TetO/TetS family tetracycline resistance ribosomal protection protein [Streptomyces]MBY8346036.1 TetM/TetW/TetO/TetS family tetracycline resistance ribosomal protection protein [Streptomyces plumbidurans]UIR22151.1 TetM/TetW/TetO/TetS family tetracycline resistance ribosomal protection protein [Streptomyces spinosirectus]
MHLLNLGILAHVDAGKTSLTERLLHTVGITDEIGSVDAGSTRTDTLALERRRGITIKSAVVSFAIDDVTVNLIDTPGHPDFIAEVERVLGVLDGAVLVVSAVEGVQAQTRILMRTLQRLRIPTLLFVNKVDRRGADIDGVLRAIRERLTPAVVPMGTADVPGTPDASFRPGVGVGALDGLDVLDVLDVLAEHDDELLAAYVEGRASAMSHSTLRVALIAQTRQALVHPVYFGSAITGAGVDALVTGLKELLPPADGDPEGPVSGTVFKVERGPAGEKVAYARMFSGTLRTRDRIPFAEGSQEGRITAISVFDQGTDARADAVPAGRIARLWGLADVRIGDALGEPRKAYEHFFAPPTLETVVVPGPGTDNRRLHLALTRLAEQDPLIDLRHDEVRRETAVSLYGEVQKEVVQATLAEEFGLEVTFRETTTICIERPAGTGSAVEFNKKDDNPFLATVGLRVDPAPIGSGIGFRLEVELGSMPYAFFRAVEDTVRETLGQGLHGWQVADCTVTMTHSGYSPRQSHAHQGFDKSMSSTGADFRGVTPLVLVEALRRAGTQVHEPMHRFRLEAPADTLGALLPVLAALRAVARTTETRGAGCVLEGDIPAGRVHELEQRLPGLTRGEGELESAFDHYAPITHGQIPERPRTDHNPLNRKEYLLNVTRRVGS